MSSNRTPWFERLFDSHKDSPSQTGTPHRQTTNESSFRPACDIRETANAIVIQMDLAGVPKDGVSMDLTGNNLRFYGFVPEIKDTGDKYWMTERSIGHFSRVFTLPDYANTSDIRADHTNGLLTVHIPKLPPMPPRPVPIL